MKFIKKNAVKSKKDKIRELAVKKPLNLDSIKDIKGKILPLINKLNHEAKEKSELQLEAINALADIGNDIAFYISALYIKDNREAVEKVALKKLIFPTSFLLNIPSGLTLNKNTRRSFYDVFRLSLTESWKSNHKLKFGCDTDFDDLRLTLEGFLRSMESPDQTNEDSRTFSITTGNEWTSLKSTLICTGRVPVPEETSKLLLMPDNSKNYQLWAKKFVHWYQKIHPWPYKDSYGYDRMLESNETIANPVHQLAYNRLLKRHKSNPSEKSVWNSLRAIVRERLKIALS